MKKKTLIATMMVITICSFGQIVIEHTYTKSDGIFISPILDQNIFKYIVYDDSTDDLILYNLNHSIFKTISTSPNPNYSYNADIFYVSDALFDTDTSTIEYMRVGLDSSRNNTYVTEIFDENGTVLFARDSGTAVVRATADGFKMIFHATDYNTYSNHTVYSLPGSLPCLSCENGMLAGGLFAPPNVGGSLRNYPNPSGTYTIIEYKLPAGIMKGEIVFYNTSGIEVKRFSVDRTFDHLRVSTEDLTSGTYYYYLQTTQGASSGKKLVTIR